MMHILNGDSLVEIFKQSGIDEDYVIWREGLALGPVEELIEDAAFLDRRALYWVGYESSPEDDFPEYASFFTPQLHKLCETSNNESVTLWFEHDLFCQANMLAIIGLLRRHGFRDVSVVSIDRHPNHPEFKGLGNLAPSELKALLPGAVNLSAQDIDFASHLWQLLCLPSPLFLQAFLKQTFPNAFPFVKVALKAHLSLFPSSRNGLHVLQEKFLSSLQSEPRNRNSSVRQLLLDDDLYGFGDLFYFKMVDELAPFYEGDQVWKLNPLGVQLLAGNVDFFDHVRGVRYLGGTIIAEKPTFRRQGDQVVPV